MYIPRPLRSKGSHVPLKSMTVEEICCEISNFEHSKVYVNVHPASLYQPSSRYIEGLSVVTVYWSVVTLCCVCVYVVACWLL